MGNFIAIDTETTGFENAQGSTLTQISAVAVHGTTGQFLSSGFLRIKLTPEDIACFSQEAIDVQGWTKEANDTGEPLADCLAKFRAWLGTVDHVGYIAHVARFDSAFCRRLGFVDSERPWFCTHQGMKLAEDRRLIRPQNHKLKTLAELCGYKFNQQHCAWDDVLACANGWSFLRGLGLSPQDMQYNTRR